MPEGVILCRWDDRLGVVLESKYPDDITQGLVDDDLLTIFSTHAMSESAGILSMRIKRFSIVSYYTGIPENEEESQFFVALVLSENENPNSFEESLTEIAKMIIDAFGKTGFDDFYIECFDRVSKMKEITEEQRYAFIFRDKVRNLLLTKLTDGSMTKEGLAKWLSKEVEHEVTDIDGLLAPLLKTELATELNISKGKKVSLEYVFLLRDVALVRTPHIEIFKAAKSGQMDIELREKYQKSVEKFFKKYRISAEDARLIAEFISNPDTYDVIKVLREGYMTREEIVPKIGREMPNLDRHLKRLAEDDIILPIKDKKQRVWIFMLCDIQAITFFPEYMVDVIRRRWKEGTIAKEIALKHLELLRAEYISTQAPKFRKKMFEAIKENFERAEGNIKKKSLDKAASNLDVCSTQSYDMGERKLGAEIANSARLLREDKDKYLEEEWEKDRKKILEYLDAIEKQLEEQAEKEPKKKKKLDIDDKKGKGPSAKAKELEEGKGKEIQKKLSQAKEEFSLTDSVDKAPPPSAPAPPKKEAPKAAPPKKEEPKKAAPPKKEAPKKAAPPKKEEPKKAAPPKKEEPKKAAPPKKEEPKKAAPTKKEEPKKAAPPKKEEPKKTGPSAKELKLKISTVEKQIKALKKHDPVRAAETMSTLADLYKQAGNAKKAQECYDEQNRMTIITLKTLQSELVKQAKDAEKAKKFSEAADLYAQCKEISSNLFKAGQMDQADKVKDFTTLEQKMRSQK